MGTVDGSSGTTGIGHAPVDVSVVIPAHRGGPFLRQAVTSVLDQGETDLEVVVVSDGCAEDLGDLERLDARVRVIRQRQAGVSVARNVGVAHSAGELVAFLDEDDLARPGRLRWQLDALSGRPRSGMCHGRFEIIDADGAVLVESRGGPVQYQDMLALDFPLLSTLMVRRAHVLEVGGFDPALVRGEDIEFFLRAAMRTDVTFVPRILTSYRRHGSNTTTGVWDIYPVILKHRRWAELNRRPDLVAAAERGLRRNRRNAACAAFDEARAARRRGALGQVAMSLAVSLARDPTFVPGVAVSRLARRPSLTPEGRMPGRPARPPAADDLDPGRIAVHRAPPGAAGSP